MTKYFCDHRLGGFMSGWVSALSYVPSGRIGLPDLDGGYERDAEAIASDWRAVGGDMRKAFDIVR